MSTGLAGFIAPDFDKTVEQEHLREKFPRKLPVLMTTMVIMKCKAFKQ